MQRNAVFTAAIMLLTAIRLTFAADGQQNQTTEKAGEPAAQGKITAPPSDPHLGQAPADQSVVAEKSSPEEAAIRATGDSYVAAFAQGNAKAAAEHFTMDAEYVDAEGNLYRGRQAIEDVLTAFFASNPGSRINLEITSLRFVGSGVALEDGVTTVTFADDPESVLRGYTAVHVKMGDRWLTASVRERTVKESRQHAAQLRQFDWLVGDWVHEGDDAIVSALVDAESEARGYVVTGDESYLNNYRRLAVIVPNRMRLLNEAVADNPVERNRISELTRIVEERSSRLQDIVDARGTQGFDTAQSQILSGSGQEEMEQLRQALNQFQIEENQLLSQRNHDQEYSLYIVLAANLTAVSIGTTLTVVAWYLVERELRKRRLAEASAHSERQNLWVTLTSIGDGVIVADAAGRVKLANPVAQQLMGHPRDAIGRPLADIFSLLNEVTREPVENPVSQVLAQGKIAGMAGMTVLVQTDGTEIPIEQTAAPIRDKSGKISGVVFVFRDCSERRRFEMEISERERRFRRMFETPLIGIAVCTSRGYLMEANDVFLDLVGYQPAQLNEAALSWSSVPQGQSPLDDRARLELRESGVCKPFEKTYTRMDGSRVPVLISAARLMDEQDCVVVFVTDLTQSKNTEAALRESDARFRILSECMPQKVWTARPDGRLDYANHMLLEYAGMTTEQLLGWGWTMLIFPDDLQNHLEAWKKSLASGDMFEVEHRVRKHTGEYRWHLARALPLYQPDSQIAMWVGTNTDIHDQKQAEETLREEHHRKDQFLALLAHELRNPLAPLSNALQVFPSVQNDPASSEALLGIMKRQLRQMTRLIDDLLDLARITTGRMRLRREPIAVESVVVAAVEAVQPLISEREHQFTVNLPQEELWVDADSARLAQILINLLHNAAKYTDSHGQLSLTVERSQNDVLFRVRDNGPGISKEMLTKIFDLFTQVELTLDRAHGGLGIGLTLVRTLVELHGGSVTASSPGPGKGSEFVVELPLAAAPLDTITVEATNTTEKPLPELRILVVDDVQASAKTLGLMLRTLGQKTEEVYDGPSAITCATKTPFDLIVLDIAMPGMDGLEVARRIRAIPELSSVTLVALTGFGQEEDRARSLQAGFNDHLIKPTSLDILKEVLKRAATSGSRSDNPTINGCNHNSLPNAK